ncbi:MAG TPA: hypothetical protein PKY22_13575, partial [Accumulibacter sp.]|nr:hypothetical protein [Accumulibacter sp.]
MPQRRSFDPPTEIEDLHYTAHPRPAYALAGYQSNFHLNHNAFKWFRLEPGFKQYRHGFDSNTNTSFNENVFNTTGVRKDAFQSIFVNDRVGSQPVFIRQRLEFDRR